MSLAKVSGRAVSGPSGQHGRARRLGRPGGHRPTGLKRPRPAPQPKMQASARTAATQFYGCTPRADSPPRGTCWPCGQAPGLAKAWVKCITAARWRCGGTARVIKAVTVFGNAAIVTERSPEVSQRTTVEAVFNYFNGRWAYSPSNIGIYQHGSVSADIAAARAAGTARPEGLAAMNRDRRLPA